MTRWTVVNAVCDSTSSAVVWLARRLTGSFVLDNHSQTHDAGHRPIGAPRPRLRCSAAPAPHNLGPGLALCLADSTLIRRRQADRTLTRQFRRFQWAETEHKFNYLVCLCLPNVAVLFTSYQ